MHRLVLVLGAVGLVSLLGALSEAEAVAPERFTVDLAQFSGDESAFASRACGFAIDASLEGHVIVSIFTNGKKPMLEIDRFNIRIRYTNRATGETSFVVDAGPDIISSTSIAIIGRSVTGSGVIGRVVLDPKTSEIFFEAGRRLNDGDGDYISAVCADLAA